MIQKRKTTFLVKIFSCVMLVCTLFGSVFMVSNLDENKQIASAENVMEVTDEITFTQDDWMSGSPTDCITLSLRINNTISGGYLYEYLVANSSIQGCWNDHASYATANGNVDIMDYLHFNGESARSIVTNNTTYVGTTSPLSYGGVYSPIAVETTGLWTSVKILNAWIPEDGFTITVKNGFKLLLNDGKTITTTDDVSFKYANGSITKIIKKETIDVTEAVSIVSNSYSENQSQFVIKLAPASTLTSNAWWNINGSALIAANSGVDIMNYIYINGENIRTLSDNNRTNNTYPVDTASGWLTNSNQCRPVFVESVADGIYVTVLHAFSTTNYTITLKAGFELLNAEGKISAITEDVEYVCEAGVLKTESTLSFDGLEDTITVMTGEILGELPAVPTVENKLGVWQIDGKDINADTVYNYGKNETAVAAYYEGTDISDTLTISDWGVVGEANYTTLVLQNSEKGLLSSNLNCWNDNGASNAGANANCDIMDYIYVNGRSARAIVTDNQNGVTNYPTSGSDDYALNLGGVYAPVSVETGDYEDGTIFVRVLTEYLEKGTFKVTVKAGFRFVTDEETLILTQDVDLKYAITYSGYADLATTAFPNTTLTEPSLIPTLEGAESYDWVFDGWFVADKESNPTDVKWDFVNDKVTGALTLAPKFSQVEKAKYDVTFDAVNGTQNTVVSVYEGSYVKEEQIPTNPVKSADGDQAFTFWYWSLDGETEYDFTTPVTGAITLTAVYTTQTLYTVTMGDTMVKVVAGEKVTKPTTDPTKESTAEFDYTFVGWYNGETKWNFDTDTVTSDLELTAKYTETKRKYTVTFNVSGKDGVSFESVEKEYGTTVDLSTLLDGVDVTGYTYTITVDGVAVTSVGVLSDVTVNVTFTERAYYTVTIGGVEQTVEEGSKVAKPATDPTKESTAEFDYTFDGWYNGETKWNFDTDTVNSDLELTAKYTEAKRKYTVTFNVTGNDSIKLDPVEVEYGTTYDLSQLLDGKDVSGYTYTIKVNGEDKLGVKVVGDVTVNIAFTKKTENNGGTGCISSISGLSGILLGMVAFGVAVVAKKKED